MNITTIHLYVDGGSRGNPGPGGGGFAVYDCVDSYPRLILEGSRFFGRVTNNQAEYQALICGLQEIRKKLGTPHLRCFADSQLMVEQLSGRYKVKSPNVKPLFLEVRQLVAQFPSFTIQHIPRGQNGVADRLANEAMDAGY